MPLKQVSLRLAGEERHLCAGPTWVSCVPAQRPAVYDSTPSGSHSADASRRVHASSETVSCQPQPLYLWSQITALLHGLNHVKSVPPLLLREGRGRPTVPRPLRTRPQQCKPLPELRFHTNILLLKILKAPCDFVKGSILTRDFNEASNVLKGLEQGFHPG